MTDPPVLIPPDVRGPKDDKAPPKFAEPANVRVFAASVLVTEIDCAVNALVRVSADAVKEPLPKVAPVAVISPAELSDPTDTLPLVLISPTTA